MSRWLDRPGYLVAAAFLAGIGVAAIIAIIVFVGSGGDDDGGNDSVVATSTVASDQTPASPQPTAQGRTPPAPNSTPSSARTPDDALTALISEQLDSTYIGPCPEAPGAQVPQGLCSIELYRSADLVTFLIGQPLSEGVGEAIITPNGDGTWSVDFVRAPEAGGPEIAIGADAMVYGAGDCLNFREEPSTTAQPVICPLDGTRARVTDGPVDAGGQTWWELEGLGWGSAQFLVRPTQ